jgi:hypothetical protein
LEKLRFLKRQPWVADGKSGEEALEEAPDFQIQTAARKVICMIIELRIVVRKTIVFTIRLKL